MFQHNELTQKPVLDAKGNMILREEYYLDGMNCDPFSFDKECEEVNARFHKNQTKDEIKSHHYILSFDPRDKDESGLTGEKAQALGLEFARRFFPGHQALVCTHTDGHNGAGNIHCHIVINSVRKLDVEEQDFMERLCDSKAGYKHHQTRSCLTAMQKGLMQICEREGLNQIDLTKESPTHITDKEYRLNQREQKNLDTLNAAIRADGLKPSKTKFQSQKQYLRDAVRDVAGYAHSFEEFRDDLNTRYNIELKDHRGRFSYLHPDREKFMTSRTLGAVTSREHLLKVFAENRVHNRKREADPEHQDAIADAIRNARSGKSFEILHIHSELRLVVDLQSNIKAMQSAAYANKVKISNLQQMALTVAYVQEQGYDTKEDLTSVCDSVKQSRDNAAQSLREFRSQISAINEQIHFTGQYLATKSVNADYKKAADKAAFRREHQNDLDRYDEAAAYIRNKLDGKVPSLTELKSQRERLLSERSRASSYYERYRTEHRFITTVAKNVDAILSYSSAKDLHKTYPERA